MRERRQLLQLCDHVRDSAFALHAHLRSGHTERIYENGLVNRLRKGGLDVVQQQAFEVWDEDGTPLGLYVADLFVEDCLIVELKACKALAAEHTAQVLGYLRASGQRDALLINFGAPKLQIRKFIL